MQSFEVNVNGQTYRILPNVPVDNTFSLFNHATFHVIKKNEHSVWEAVQHRFGTDNIPLDEIGEAIDNYYNT